jgi:starch phosphorylase
MEKHDRVPEFLSLVDIEGYEQRYHADIVRDRFFGMPLAPVIDAEKRLRSPGGHLAYFSMEYGLASSFYNTYTASRPVDAANRSQEHEVFSNFRLADYFFSLKLNTLIDLPIYSGGLGVLAGDTVKTMADYRLPAVAVGMLWNAGYFRQKFWFKYGQTPEEMHWDLYSYPGLIPLKNKIAIDLKSETVWVRLWKYYVFSYQHDYCLPLVLLDSNLPENSEQNRRLTEQLYKADNAWIKIMQRVILGLGGVFALKELGYPVELFHLNEGHAIFAFIAKAREHADRQELKNHFVYTCHTPVEAGHDRFSSDDMRRILKDHDYAVCEEFGKEGGLINLTLLSMNASRITNAVSLNHQKVMHLQFPSYRERIVHVTNGVHTHTWMSARFKKLLESHAGTLGDTKANPMALAQCAKLKGNKHFREEVWKAHQANKADLCGLLEKWKFSPDVFTLCWARRVAAYKRPSLILQDVQALVDLARSAGPLQVIFAGKAHPRDNLGFTYINDMLDSIDRLHDSYDVLKIVMLENYDICLARLLTSGVDVWLNNPLPPFEASGTSGMKAILNAVLQLTTLDGWVVEAEHSSIGRFFGYRNPEGFVGDEKDLRLAEDSRLLYGVLSELVSLYYATNTRGQADYTSAWVDMMIECLCAGGFFNTYRMADQYKQQIWHIS